MSSLAVLVSFLGFAGLAGTIEIDSALPQECYGFCAPLGPHTPFAWPSLFWIDSFRVLVVVLGLILSGWMVAKARDTRSSGQRARLTGNGIAALIIIGTELDRMGDYPHWRLFASFFCILLLLWGTSRMAYEIPPRDTKSPRDGA